VECYNYQLAVSPLATVAFALLPLVCAPACCHKSGQPTLLLLAKFSHFFGHFPAVPLMADLHFAFILALHSSKESAADVDRGCGTIC